jgi:hypothetical protein
MKESSAMRERLEDIGVVVLKLAGWLVVAALKLVAFALFATQAILEPIVRVVLAGLATAGMLVTLLFGVVLQDPHFPTLFMAAASLACFALLVGYYALMRALGGWGHEHRHR